MDPITAAIVGALPALATEMVSSAVKDAYAGLKSLMVRKFGATTAVAESVEDLEANPKSQGRAMVLSEHVEEAKATSDADIMAAVNKLVEALAKDRARRDFRCAYPGNHVGWCGRDCRRAERVNRIDERRLAAKRQELIEWFS
jgi:hypothetical protein